MTAVFTERQLEVHAARVYLAEATRRRGQPFSFTLLQWAANARKRAAAIPIKPRQGDLFGRL